MCQAFQLPAGLWGLAEPDLKMLQGEHRKDSGLLEHRLGVHAVCARCQEGTAELRLSVTEFALELVSL